jgi:hypothetical protein
MKKIYYGHIRNFFFKRIGQNNIQEYEFIGSTFVELGENTYYGQRDGCGADNVDAGRRGTCSEQELWFRLFKSKEEIL